MPRNYRYVKLVGVELEGGWREPPFDVGHDGSVNVNANVVGEVASPPMRPHEVEAWTLAHYPQSVNHTAGIHVHVSTHLPMHYARLMDPKFFAYFTAAMQDWGKKMNIIPKHPFWDRLAGKNQYCKKDFIPDEQVTAKSKGSNRYTQLNYCYGLHSTVECRLLPTFKMPNIAVSAIMKVVDTFELYLRENKQVSKKIAVRLTDKDIESDDPVMQPENEDLPEDPRAAIEAGDFFEELD